MAIRLLLLDVDGIMTDGTKTYDIDHNVISKKYCDLDFTAIRRFIASNVSVLLVSGDSFNIGMSKKRNIPLVISKDKVKEHSLTLIDETKDLSACFYFSHNSNVPTQSLRLSKNFQDAIDIMTQYHHSLKYVSFKNETGQISFVDCTSDPDNKLCRGNKY